MSSRLLCLSLLLCSAIMTPLVKAADGKVLHLGLAGEPATLDPHRYNLRIEEAVLGDLFLGLTTFSADGKLMPGAALKWDVSEDGLIWTFYLDPKGRWSDGKAVTAKDFVYSFRRLINPETAASLAYFMYPLRNAEAIANGQLKVDTLGVRAVDDLTLELTLALPYPHLPERLLYPTAYPVPAHVIDKVGDAWVKPQNWVSNGAYLLRDWKPQQHLELARNPHFEPKPAALQVFHHPAANAQNAWNRFRAGTLDAIAAFPANELATIRTERAAELHLAPQLSMIYLVFNTRKAPFSDPRVREALAIVVEPTTLTDKVMKSGDIPVGSFVPPMVADYTHPALPHAGQPLGDRQRRARALLTSAGFGPANPLKLTLRYAAGTDAKRANLATAAFWQQIGVRVELHQSELKVHYADLRQGNFDVAQAGWLGESNPEHYLGLLHSRAGDTNYGAFADQAVDALIDDARRQKDIAARHRLLAEAETAAMKHYPVMPLFALTSRRLVRAELRGWHDNPRDAHPARFLVR